VDIPGAWMLLTLVVVGKNQADLDKFDRSHLEAVGELVLFDNASKLPLSAIGNRYLNHGSAGVVGLCHADCLFHAGALDAFNAEAEKGTVCGIVGRNDGGYCWCYQNPGPVSTLDSCSVFLRADLGLRFDTELFVGFHCHVEDLCLQAKQKGILAMVPPANARHLGVVWQQKVEGLGWYTDYIRYRECLAKKWSSISFVTT